MRLVARQLGHCFIPERPLFADLSFSLSEGDLVAVRGPSGSGKSTLLSILAGWTRPTDGTVTGSGVERMTWVPQNPLGIAHRSALDHLVLPLLTRGLSRGEAEDIAQVELQRFDLKAQKARAFAELSGGEAQRLMLARAVLADVDLLLIDEPTAQLDRSNARQVINTLDALADENRIVVVATHDELVAAACERQIRLDPVAVAT